MRCIICKKELKDTRYNLCEECMNKISMKIFNPYGDDLI